MKLIHTLLLLIRAEMMEYDLELARKCLKTLEKSTYQNVVIYNQGCLERDALTTFLGQFRLTCFVIGDGVNVGTVVGRQSCFEYAYNHFAEVSYLSEIHPDMMFASNWEDSLVNYLDENEDEPMISCGIVTDLGGYDEKSCAFDIFLKQFQRDQIICGFHLPCIHKVSVLKEVGGYDARFLKGMQAFEDDSLLLGYHYYYGKRMNWVPKVNLNSVVYHAVAGQRFGLDDNLYCNYNGLLRQYGAMGLLALTHIHVSLWQSQFFNEQFNLQIAENESV